MTENHGATHPSMTDDQKELLLSLVAKGVDGLVHVQEMKKKLDTAQSRIDNKTPNQTELLAEQRRAVEKTSTKIGMLIWIALIMLGVDAPLTAAMNSESAMNCTKERTRGADDD